MLTPDSNAEVVMLIRPLFLLDSRLGKYDGGRQQVSTDWGRVNVTCRGTQVNQQPGFAGIAAKWA